MPDLLLELFSEEIPARMQRKAAEDLRKLVTDALVDAGLVYEGAKAFATPRRLALTVHGLPSRSPDRREERKGPRVGAPDKAIEGFLKAAGLASIDQAKVQPDKKGDVYVAVIETPGRSAEEVIAGIVPAVVRGFPWPKSMRWGTASAKPGSLSWVRPLHSILCVFGPETADTEIVLFEVGGIRSGDATHGHRFMAPGLIAVKRFDDYAVKLEKAKVVLDADRRKDIILADARDRALALGLELVEDEGLLEEVAGLVEWPVVLVGAFDADFLDIPPEVIRTTIRANQKCFVLRRPGDVSFEAPLRGASQDEDALAVEGATGKPNGLANRFILVANIEAPDDGAAIVAGNERVIRARLADARHFWNTDRHPLPDHDTPEMRAAAERLGLDLAKPLDQRMAKLAATNVVFHEKLGTQGERMERIARLAGEIAPLVGADPAKARRAAVLAKADLVSGMVGEFPELQGLMGRYYAAAQGEDPAVAAAIEDHYRPVGPSDRVPTDPVAIAVALADKLDTLVGFWFEEEKPTGSKDPYALRRAALGVLSAILANDARVRLVDLMASSWRAHAGRGSGISAGGRREAVTPDLLAFFHDRLKVQLREQGARHDLVDAVLSSGEGTTANDDLLLIVRRVEALGRFLDTEDGGHLLTGYRRAANILREEEKKAGETYDSDVDPGLLAEREEKVLYEAIGAATGEAAAAAAVEDFDDAMRALAKLRAPVDIFFDKVLVNAPEPAVRANRLRLLNRIRVATAAVADFSKIEG